MAGVMDGVRVVEVAIYGFVPAAGVALADWGADVLKIEHARTGDPLRNLTAYGIKPGANGYWALWEVFNRGKRGLGIDLATEEGRDLLLRLVDEADVFLTNFTEDARKKLRIEPEDIQGRNPRIIYGRGTGYGPLGADRNAGGFDGITYWARSGAASGAMPMGAARPIGMPGPGFGDIQSGMHLAGGIAAALYHRERTGEAIIVDTSLQLSGMWAMEPGMVGAIVSGVDELPKSDLSRPNNPVASMTYRTSDNRFIALSMLESDRYWEGFVTAIGHPELATDERFTDISKRAVNSEACVAALDAIFAEHPLAHWEAILATQAGQWSVIRRSRESVDDPQAIANGFIQHVDHGEGRTLPMVIAPVQFSTGAPALKRGPQFAEHTDEILLELGLSMDELIELKIKGAIT